MVFEATLKIPIEIGLDHLDARSIASSYGEAMGMLYNNEVA
jgi:urocanate hydratase